MAGYVDGFVMPLPKANVERYREIATAAGEAVEGARGARLRGMRRR